MIDDDARGRNAALAETDSDQTRVGDELDHDGAVGFRAPARAAGVVFGIAGHRIGDDRIDDPVSRGLLEVAADCFRRNRGADFRDAIILTGHSWFRLQVIHLFEVPGFRGVVVVGFHIGLHHAPPVAGDLIGFAGILAWLGRFDIGEEIETTAIDGERRHSIGQQRGFDAGPDGIVLFLIDRFAARFEPHSERASHRYILTIWPLCADRRAASRNSTVSAPSSPDATAGLRPRKVSTNCRAVACRG